MGAILAASALSSPGLIAQVPTVDLNGLTGAGAEALNRNRGWTPILGGKVEVRFKGVDANGRTVYEARGGKSTVAIRADSFAQAAQRAQQLVAAKALAPRAMPASAQANKSQNGPATTGTTFGGVRLDPSTQRYQVPTKSSFLGTSPGYPTGGNAATKKTATAAPAGKPVQLIDVPRLGNGSPSTPLSPVRSPLQTGPADPMDSFKPIPSLIKPKSRVELAQTMEKAAKAAGFRSLSDLVTRPEFNPAKNESAKAFWKKISQDVYRDSGGVYGMDANKRIGTNGPVTKVIDVDRLVEKGQPLLGKSTVGYSLLGAAAQFNVFQATGLSPKEAAVQLPLGVFRDLVNIGLAKLPLGTDNVWVDATINGSTGAALTFLTNAGAGKLGIGPEKNIGRGMWRAAFTVNFSLATLKAMRQQGLLGDEQRKIGGEQKKPPADWQQWAQKVVPEAFAVGLGVTAAMVPAGRAKALSEGAKFGFKEFAVMGAKTTGYPAAQWIVSEFIYNPPTPGTGSPKQPPQVNGGSAANAKADLVSDLMKGANPYELADQNRKPNGDYVNRGVPALGLAASVRQLQELTRSQSNTPNVRTNQEAVGVIRNAYRASLARQLTPAAETTLRRLFVAMNQYDMYFGSEELKSEVTHEKRMGGGLVFDELTPAVDAKEQKFLKQVFAGQIPARRNSTERQDPAGDVTRNLAWLYAFAKGKGNIPVVVFTEAFSPQGGYGLADQTDGQQTGFATRITNRFGGALKAMGLNEPAVKLTSQQRKDVDEFMMQAFYKSVKAVVNSRPGSSTQHGSSNAPTGNDPGGSYYFSAFMKMNGSEKAAVKRELDSLLAHVIQKIKQ
jgi:hypothetical protein